MLFRYLLRVKAYPSRTKFNNQNFVFWCTPSNTIFVFPKAKKCFTVRHIPKYNYLVNSTTQRGQYMQGGGRSIPPSQIPYRAPTGNIQLTNKNSIQARPHSKLNIKINLNALMWRERCCLKGSVSVRIIFET